MGPAGRLAFEEAANALGGRTEGLHNAVEEQAVTHAIIVFSALRVAFNKVVPASDRLKYLAQFFDTAK